MLSPQECSIIMLPQLKLYQWSSTPTRYSYARLYKGHSTVMVSFVIQFYLATLLQFLNNYLWSSGPISACSTHACKGISHRD